MCFWLVETNFSRGTTNQNHYQDLSSDTSSVWNFCARSTEVISRGNQRVSSWNVGRFLRLLKNPFLFLLVSAPACLNKICLFPHASSADWYTYTSLKRDYNVRSRHFPLGYHFFSYLFPRLSQFFVGSLPCSERFFPGYLLGIVEEKPIHHIIVIIIRSKFFFLFIGRESSTWPANNCLQIMVCSCAMPSNSVWFKCYILLMRKGNSAFLLLAIALAWKW